MLQFPPVLAVKIEPLTLHGPAIAPPPKLGAEFSLKVLLVTRAVVAQKMAPPLPESTEFPTKVLLVTVKVPLPLLEMAPPPPMSSVEFPIKVLLVTVNVPLL